MLEKLKESVYLANLELVEKGVVIYTWGNVSGIDRTSRRVVIKPSGVNYREMNPKDMVVVSLETGEVIEGDLKPSSDTDTHLELYRLFENIEGIAHTHSVHATAFAQAGMAIPAFGTTHADYFYGDIPCTRELLKDEVESYYEKNTGKVIAETVRNMGYNPIDIPGILVRSHGPFAWGRNVAEAVHNAVVMETIAEIGLKTLMLRPDSVMAGYVLDKHYTRKHGVNAYYGQKRKL